MVLYRQEDLDDQFIADARKVHEEQLEAMDRCIRKSALENVCPQPENLNKPRDARKLLASLMLLGVLAHETTGENYVRMD